MNWNLVDSELRKYLTKYKKEQLMLEDNIQNILNNKVEDINKYASRNDLERFKRFLRKNEELIKDNEYVAYIVKKDLKKSKILYRDILKTILYVEYVMFEAKNNENQLDTLKNISNIAYEYGSKLCEEKEFKVKDGWKWHDAGVLALMLLPLNTGLTYKEQNDSTAIYNAEELYKTIIRNVNQQNNIKTTDTEIQKLFAKQLRQELNIKINYYVKPMTDTFNNGYITSGAIDNMSTFVVNQVLLEVFNNYGVDKVIFIAREDNKTTNMCKSLNGQKFNLRGFNIYDRYSAIDEKNVVYTTEGLKVGENLPPINNHFHWCRSWIEPYKE